MRIFAIATILCALALPARAQELPCAALDKTCLLDNLETMTAEIGEDDWRDQTYRELAKLYVHEKKSEKAVALIARIHSPDKKAMTVRAIGIEAAQTGLGKEEYDTLFTALRAEAEKIDHPPSYAIALNYIADAQALAGDDTAALKTAKDIENREMRNKALYDSAKTQAEQARIPAAIAGIETMDDPGFRDKAYLSVSKIRTEEKDYEGALKLASRIVNKYQRAQAVLAVLAKQITPDEVSLTK